MTAPADRRELATLESSVDRWLDAQRAENPVVLTVERDAEPRRWFVRMKGEQKDVFTIRMHLQQRTLHYETHFMPAPEENHERLYDHLLRRNLKMYGASFAIGDEEAIYIQGQLDNALLSETEIDRVLGSVYTWVEQFFRPAMRIGYASKFV